ncbi:MAG: rhomboid family intramembrane serine protease [Verrucomicrobia bacterium]|jgi:membrane associated rhomboid family serine protease|nr:rhomboid family intramembrane serine protease [Verrucomicrobiota bacterium]
MLYDRPYMRESPYGTDQQKTSIVTTLIVITVAVFVLQQILNVFFPGAGGQENRFLTDWFALSGQNFKELKVWTIVSYAFLHSTAGFLHILGNMLGLFFIGRIVEPIVGRNRFLLLYFGASLLGGIVYLLFHFNDPAIGRMGGDPVFQSMVGASASVMGILAFFCLMYPERQITLLLFFIIPITVKPKWVFWGSLIISAGGILLYELPNQSLVAHSAHLGGLFAGIAYYRFFHNRPVNLFNAREPSATVEPPAWFKRRKKTEVPISYKVNRSNREELQTEVDRILDKINESGFGSLTENEKKVLDRAKDILSS